jgi:hypothetical protein
VKLTSSRSCAEGILIPAPAVLNPDMSIGAELYGPVKSAKLKSGMLRSPVFCSIGKYLSHSAYNCCQSRVQLHKMGACLTQSISSIAPI